MENTTCTDIGDANPDIAGIGVRLGHTASGELFNLLYSQIISSFLIQCPIAILLSWFHFYLRIRGYLLQVKIDDLTTLPRRERQAETHAIDKAKLIKRKRRIAARIILNSSDVLTIAGISLVVAGMFSIVLFHSTIFILSSTQQALFCK